MDYDVLILGGGIIGCAVAYELSKYNINIALIEKDYDVANDISIANAAVIYDGSEAQNKQMIELEYRGMNLIKEHCKKFNISYNKIGSFRFSANEIRKKIINDTLKNSYIHKIEGIRLMDNNEVEKNIISTLSNSIDEGICSENVAIIQPYNLAVSYAEIAADNGVNFRFEEEVIDITPVSKGFKVTTNKNKFTCKFVINTIANEAFSNVYNSNSNHDKNKDMKCIILKRKTKRKINKVLIYDIDENNFVIRIPISKNKDLICIKDEGKVKLNINSKFKDLFYNNIEKELITNIFMESYNKKEMFIDDSNLNESYLQIIGNHYSKITISPALAEDIAKKVKNNMNIVEKRYFINKKRENYVFRNMNQDQINKIVSVDKRYGNIICNCNNVSEGEIIDSIRRPLGARTLEGVKRRTGIGLGSCNGANCNMKIIKILAREMNKSVLDIVDDSMKSNILVGRIKEFDEI